MSYILVSYFIIIRVCQIFTENLWTLNLDTTYTVRLVGFPAHIELENEVFVGSRNTDKIKKWTSKKNKSH